jgi:hypothetical protein
MRCAVLRECTQETFYKGRKIKIMVLSDALWSWRAQYIVWPTMDRTGEGNSRTTTTTIGILAYNELEALALATEEIHEMIDSRLI